MEAGLRRISRNCCEIALSFQAVIFILGNIFSLEIEIFKTKKGLSFQTINVGNIWKFGKIQDCCWAACGGVFSVSLGKHNISHLAFLLKLFSIAPFSNHQKWAINHMYKFVHLLYLDKICRGWREKCLWSWNLWELATIWISWQLSPIKLVLQHTSSASNTFSPNFHKIFKSRNSIMCWTMCERYQFREWWQTSKGVNRKRFHSRVWHSWKFWYEWMSEYIRINKITRMNIRIYSY